LSQAFEVAGSSPCPSQRTAASRLLLVGPLADGLAGWLNAGWLVGWRYSSLTVLLVDELDKGLAGLCWLVSLYLLTLSLPASLADAQTHDISF
jgi:hypothetical protein